MRSIRESSSWVLAVVFAFALGTTGCSGELPAPIPTANPDSTTPRRGGSLTSASFGDMRALDPANESDGLAPQILQAMFAGLIDFDNDGKIIPDLADHWTVSDDGTSIRFVLHEGVRFQDGEELTADDVKRSVERSLSSTSPNPYSAYFGSIVGYADFNGGKVEHLEGVTVDGRYVVTFRLDKPDAAFLPLLAMHPLRPVCKSGGSKYVDTWHPCGAGPFKLLPGGWDRGRQITLVRHDGYFRPGLPYLDEVRFLYHVNFTSQRFKFTTGDIDILRDFLGSDILKFQVDPRWKPFGAYDGDKQVAGLAMNTEMPPFDNIEIRRAIAAVLNRDELVQVRASNLRPAYMPIPPGVDGYDPTIKGQGYDYAAALEHMKKAGYPFDPKTGKGGWPHVIPYVTYGQSLDEYMVQVTQQMLARIGIRIEVRIVNYATFIALRGRRKQVAFGPQFWQQDYPEAGSFLEPLFSSKGINDEDSNNWSFYKNPVVDELVERARHTIDPVKRKSVYREAQEIICDEAPWAFTHYYRFYAQWHPYVRDYHAHPSWTTDPTRVWIDRLAGKTASRSVFSGDALAKLLGDRARDSGPRRGPP